MEAHGTSDEHAVAVRRVAVIGAGPRGVGLLERLAVNLHGDSRGAAEVHLVDPFPPGGGRIWRDDQSPLLRLNSMAQDVTMYTDETSTIAGPLATGPSLIEWAAGIRSGRIRDAVLDDAVRGEVDRLAGTDFPTRRLQSAYLRWVFEQAVALLPPEVTVHVHRDTATGVDDLPDGRQRVRLASGGDLPVDVVVYALGHAGSAPDGEVAALHQAALRTGLVHVPPAFTADADLSAIEPGEPVIVRGMGLAATDLLVLLTEGRGGRFEPAEDGALRYLPSGREPRVLIGSGRGVPYRSKITAVLQGERPLPVWFTPAVAEDLAARPSLDFRDDVWPLIAKELLHGWYAELFTGHPDRVTTAWAGFRARFAPLDPWSDGLRELVEATVPDPRDRLDLRTFLGPLEGTTGLSPAALQDLLRAHVREDLRQRTQQDGSAAAGLFTSLLHALFALLGVIDRAAWTARSRHRDLEGWWMPTFSYIASGPPGHRLRELLALSEAGVVEFLGAGLAVVVDEQTCVFRATSTTTGAETVAHALVDAWLPPARAARSENTALRDLVESAVGTEQVLADDQHSFNSGRLVVSRTDVRVVDPDGTPHPRRYAIGPYTTAPFVGAFARPRTNALSFRENDAVARSVLTDLGLLRSGSGTTAPAEPQPAAAG